MKALYVTSIENFSGKTAVLLGLGKRLQAEGHKLGYYKPVSYEALNLGAEVIDEDVTFVRNVLALSDEPRDLAGVVVTLDMLPDCMNPEVDCGFMGQIHTGYKKLSDGKDIMLIEGGGSLRQGYALGISTPSVAEELDCNVLAVVKYRGRLRVLDDALAAQYRLGDRLMGVVLNRVPDRVIDYVSNEVVVFLEERGIPVFGILPERPSLAAISVGELVSTLNANILTGEDLQDALVETLMVGAMGAQEALSRFRKAQNKAIITGGDRTDIQLAALDTSTVALILTGNLTPSATVIERAEEQGVAVLVVKSNTMETVEIVEDVHGKTRLGQPEKLARFEALMAEHVDYKRLLSVLDV